MSATLALRHVGAGVAAHWRRLARRRDSMPFDWMDSSWQLQLRPLLEQRSGLTVLQIEWGGTPVLIKFDESWLQQVGREVLQVDDLRAVPDVLRPMVIEAAFEGLASLIEGATRKRFSLLKIDPEPAIRPACPHGVALLLENGDTEIEGEIWLDDTGLGYLASALRPLPAASDSEDWGALPATVDLGVGWTVMPLSCLRNLKKRDVVMLDECWIGGELDRIVIRVGKLGVAARISGRHVTVMEELGAIMEDPDEQDVDEGVEFGDLPVRLCFDLGERQLTLAELMGMGPGHVFDLGREVRRAVIIRANGKMIGEGELVDVDGQVGVSILSLAPPERA